MVIIKIALFIFYEHSDMHPILKSFDDVTFDYVKNDFSNHSNRLKINIIDKII